MQMLFRLPDLCCIVIPLIKYFLANVNLSHTQYCDAVRDEICRYAKTTSLNRILWDR